MPSSELSNTMRNRRSLRRRASSARFRSVMSTTELTIRVSPSASISREEMRPERISSFTRRNWHSKLLTPPVVCNSRT